jgi:beta-lactamase regulating signal transducer with metallopeptidase domain
MGPWVERLAGLGLDAAAAGLVLSTGSVLLMVACRQPARRLVLARATLAGLLVLPFIVALAPWPRLDVVGALPVAVRAAGSAASGFLCALYLVSLAAGMVVLGLGLLAIRRLRERARPPSEGLASAYREVAGGRRRPPELRVSERVRSPVLIGAIRGAILVPPTLEDPGRAHAARLALRHELAHHDRRDAAFGLLGTLVGAFWIFLPMVWWIRAQMRLDQEFLADCAASEDFGPFGSYASTLLDLAAPGGGSGNRSVPDVRAPRVAASGAPLRLRILMLVRCPFAVELHVPRWSQGVLAAMVALGTVLVSSLTLGGWRASGPSAAPLVASDHGSFRVARLRIDAPRIGEGSRPRPFSLPCPLPDRFELTARILATYEELAEFRILGRRLGPVPGSPVAEPAGLHALRIVRDERGVDVWVDGIRIPSREGDGAELPERLNLQPPPGVFVLLRDLELRW